MTEPASVVWVTEESPDRNLGGGNIRQAHLLTVLGRRVPTDLILVGHLEDRLTRAALASVTEVESAQRLPRSELGRRATGLVSALGAGPLDVFSHRRTRRDLREAFGTRLAGADLVVLSHQALASVLPKQRRGKWVANLHHVSAEMARQEQRRVVGRRQRWLLDREIDQARRLEGWIAGSFDAVCVVCEEDRDLLGVDPSHAVVVPNGVDLSRYVPTALGSAPRVLLPASLNFLPNVEGAQWFCEEVWGRVRAALPVATLDLVGRAPVPKVAALAELPGVSVRGDVDSMVEWLDRARVVIVPLHIGTGTRLKALEAMAAGRPVVGTSVGLGGLGLVDGVEAVIVDDPVAMADAVVDLLTDQERAEAIAAAGRRLVAERFDWDRIGTDFADRMIELAGLEG